MGEAPGPGPFLRLGMESLARWREFARALGEEAGVDVDLRLRGKLLLAPDEDAVVRLRARARWLADEGLRVEWTEGPDVPRREPGAAGGAGALWLPEEGQVDNRALARALRAAAERAGCRLREGTAVSGLVARGGRVHAVRLEDGTELGAERVVLAAGAWSGGITGLPRPLPVRPVRGQMLGLASAQGAMESPVRAVVETESCYVVPRGPASGAAVWVGATSEDVGFVRGSTPDACAALLAAAAAAVPALAGARVVERWDGFRPATPDGLPVLGADPDLEGLTYATGHYRNGILLTPITAELVTGVVEGRPHPALAPFRPDRFGTRPRAGAPSGES